MCHQHRWLYEARLLDEKNTWDKPTEEQEKIITMTAENNSLKKERRGTATKKDKEKPASKKPATKKTPAKKTKEQKKKANDKWAWKRKPPKETDSKENNAFIKIFEGKKYFWCIHHNNGAGMWTLHHPNDCEAGKATTGATANANLAAFDTMDSDSDQE